MNLSDDDYDWGAEVHSETFKARLQVRGDYPFRS